MPDYTYTTLLNNDVEDLEMKLYDEDISSDDLIDYISVTFRSFSDALNVFLTKYTDYSGSLDSVDERKAYIVNKYETINYDINPAVVKRWLTKAAPGYTSDSKEKMYALCFALNFNVTITKEFFQKVYFDRCFDCHNVDEAIYYYCMNNNLPYSQAVDLINEYYNRLSIQSQIDSDNGEQIVYTRVIQQRIETIHDNAELVNYLISNIGASGGKTKITAKETFYHLLDNILGTREEAELIKNNPRCVYDYSSTRPIKSLATLEYYKNTIEPDPLLRIYSDGFLITQILETGAHEESFTSRVYLPALLKSSFPDRHVLNDLRLYFEKGSKTVKNDAVRKTILLLFFYKFWCEQYLEINPVELELQSTVFLDEINDCITECGFESLYLGNPYDWIFIFASKCEDPLNTLRDIYSSLTTE